MKLTKSSWFIYSAAFLPFAIIEVLKRMSVLADMSSTFVGTFLFGTVVFSVATIFVLIEGGAN